MVISYIHSRNKILLLLTVLFSTSLTLSGCQLDSKISTHTEPNLDQKADDQLSINIDNNDVYTIGKGYPITASQQSFSGLNSIIDISEVTIESEGTANQYTIQDNMIYFLHEGEYNLTFAYNGLEEKKFIAVESYNNTLSGVSQIRSADGISCITLSDNDSNIVVSRCDSENTRQLWQIESTRTAGYIQSQFAIDNNLDKTCLGAKQSSHRSPYLITCHSSGGSDYQSKRKWQVEMTKLLPQQVSLKLAYWTSVSKPSHLLTITNDGNVIIVDPNDGEVANKEWLLDVPVTAVEQRPVVGNRKVLVLDTYYQGEEPNSPERIERIRKAVFDTSEQAFSLAQAISMSSHGKLTLTGDMFDSIPVGSKPKSCNALTRNTAIDYARKTLGVDIAQYDYIITNIQSTYPCGWSGVAGINANWLVANDTAQNMNLLNHEFGHNLGASHGESIINCTREANGFVMDSNCKFETRNDHSDSVNGGKHRLYPLPYHTYSGWLDPALNVPLITQSGRYHLNPLWSDGEIQGYRLPLNDIENQIFIEYRQQQNQYEDWQDDSEFITGIILRRANVKDKGHIRNHLIDSNSYDPGKEVSANNNAPLLPGEYMSVPEIGLTLNLISADDNGAIIDVLFDPPFGR